MFYRTLLVSLSLSLSVVCCLVATPVLAEERVLDLVDASMEQLQDKKLAAQQVVAALQQAVGGGTDEAKSKANAAPGKKGKHASVRVPAKPRAYQTSESKVPSALDPGVGAKSFASMRRRLEESPSNGITLAQLADYVAQFPSHREARLLLGRGQVLINATDSALATLEPLMASAEPDWQAAFWMGSAYLVRGEIHMAKQHMEAALDKHGDASELWIQAAVLEQEEDRHASAIQFLEVAAQLNPNQAEVHLNKAYSLEHLGQYKKALASYRAFLVSHQSKHTQGLRSKIMRRIAVITSSFAESQAQVAASHQAQVRDGVRDRARAGEIEGVNTAGPRRRH